MESMFNLRPFSEKIENHEIMVQYPKCAYGPYR